MRDEQLESLGRQEFNKNSNYENKTLQISHFSLWVHQNAKHKNQQETISKYLGILSSYLLISRKSKNESTCIGRPQIKATLEIHILDLKNFHTKRNHGFL